MEELSIAWGLIWWGNSARNAPSDLVQKLAYKIGQWSFCKKYAEWVYFSIQFPGLFPILFSENRLSSNGDSVDFCTFSLIGFKKNPSMTCEMNGIIKNITKRFLRFLDNEHESRLCWISVVKKIATYKIIIIFKNAMAFNVNNITPEFIIFLTNTHTHHFVLNLYFLQ